MISFFQTPGIPERRKSTVKSDHHCPSCQLTFENIESKKNHVRTVHPCLRRLFCQSCPKTIFFSNLHLKAHQMATKHAPIAMANSLQCEHKLCKNLQPFKKAKELALHVEENHAFQCSQCPRHLRTSVGLAKHFKKVHTNGNMLSGKLSGNTHVQVLYMLLYTVDNASMNPRLFNESIC